MAEFMTLVIIDVGFMPWHSFLLGWSAMGREYGEWTWVGRFYG